MALHKHTPVQRRRIRATRAVRRATPKTFGARRVTIRRKR